MYSGASSRPFHGGGKGGLVRKAKRKELGIVGAFLSYNWNYIGEI